MRGPQVRRQAGLVHGKPVVLAGDADAAGIQILDGVVGTVVAELHLEGLGARGQGHDLVTQTDAEGGQTCVHQGTGGGNGVVAGLRVTRTVAQEHAIRLQGQHLGRGRLGGDNGDPAAAAGQHAQDVEFHTEVVGHHVEARLRRGAVAGAKHPFSLCPLEGSVHRHFLRQVQPSH